MDFCQLLLLLFFAPAEQEREAEADVPPSSELSRHHIVQIDAKQQPPYPVDTQHDQAFQYAEVLVLAVQAIKLHAKAVLFKSDYTAQRMRHASGRHEGFHDFLVAGGQRRHDEGNGGGEVEDDD